MENNIPFKAIHIQKGNSRIYLDDNGYYFTMAEFQPYTLKKGAFLNIGLCFLFNKDDYLSFSYSYNDSPRVGNKFVEYINDEPFFKRIIDSYNYPKDVNEINKEYVIQMIKDQRQFWHQQSAMKKMPVSDLKKVLGQEKSLPVF